MDIEIGLTPWQRLSHSQSEPASDDGTVAVSSFAAQAAEAEGLGYWSIWLPESHFSEDAVPSPLLHLAGAATRTRQIVLGTTSLLLPIRHPILLAEEIATLDHLAAGRLIIGLGRGFRRTLFTVMNVNASQKRDLFDASLRTMKEAWSGKPLSGNRGRIGPTPVHGGSDTLRGAVPPSGPLLSPPPLQTPHPPLWMAAFGPKALRQAAIYEMPYLASPIEGLVQIGENYGILQQFAEQAGTVPSPTKPMMRTVFVNQHDGTLRKVREALNAERTVMEKQLAPILRRALQAPLSERALIGSFNEVQEQVEALGVNLGTTHLIARCQVPGASDSEIQKSVESLSALC